MNFQMYAKLAYENTEEKQNFFPLKMKLLLLSLKRKEQ